MVSFVRWSREGKCGVEDFWGGWSWLRGLDFTSWSGSDFGDGVKDCTALACLLI